MKKTLFVLLSFVFIFSSFFIPSFATSDSTPPKLIGVTVDKTTVNASDTLTFTVTATDDLSGIVHIYVGLAKEDGSASSTIWTNEKTGENTYEAKFTVDKNISPGKWYIYQIILIDNANNEGFYLANTSENFPLSYGPKISFTVYNSKYVQSAIQLKEISLSKNSVKHPESVTIRAKVTSNSPLNAISIGYSMDGNTDNWVSVMLIPESGDWYSGVLNPGDQPNVYKKYVFTSLNIWALNNDYVQYVPLGYFNSSADYLRTVSKNLDITITNARTGLEKIPPELLSIEPSKSSVSPPGVFTYKVHAGDEGGSNLRNASIVVSHVNAQHKETQIQEASTTKNFDQNGYASFDVTVSPYMEQGTIQVTKCVVTDNDGNKTEYSTEASAKSIEPFSKQSEVKIVQSTGIDVVTGTLMEDMLSKIKNAGNNAVIYVDCAVKSQFPKAGFDAVKGTDKTLILQNNGVQWVFSGNNMPNQTKDIDTCLDISMISNTDILDCRVVDAMNDGQPALILNFRANGLLPGPATVLIKAEYTFREYVGVENLYFYFLNKDSGEMDLVAQKLKLNADGYYVLPVEHNSTFVLSSSPVNAKYVSVKSGGKSKGEGKQLINKIEETAAAQSMNESSKENRSDISEKTGKNFETEDKKQGGVWPIVAAVLGGIILLGGAAAVFVKRKISKR